MKPIHPSSFSILTLLCVFVTAVFLSACQFTADSTAAPEGSADVTTSPAPTELPYQLSIYTDYTAPTADANGTVMMLYPQIEYPSDTDTETAVNDLIRARALEEFKKTGFASGDISSYSYVTETALVTVRREAFFSAVITGYYFAANAAHPEYFSYSINCDIANRKLLTSEDIISDFAQIRGLFMEGAFTQTYGIDGLLEETSYTDIFTQYRADYGIYPDVYFTSDSLGLIIEIVYHLGGSACFEIPYTDSKAYLHSELAAIASLLTATP